MLAIDSGMLRGHGVQPIRKLIARGQTRVLVLTETEDCKSVDNCRSAIRRKLEIRTRSELVGVALEAVNDPRSLRRRSAADVTETWEGHWGIERLGDGGIGDPSR